MIIRPFSLNFGFSGFTYIKGGKGDEIEKANESIYRNYGSGFFDFCGDAVRIHG